MNPGFRIRRRQLGDTLAPRMLRVKSSTPLDAGLEPLDIGPGALRLERRVLSIVFGAAAAAATAAACVFLAKRRRFI